MCGSKELRLVENTLMPVAGVVAAHSGPVWLSGRIAAWQCQRDVLGSRGVQTDVGLELAVAVERVVRWPGAGVT